MKLETTIEKIEEVVKLLEVFGSKRKPLIKRKFTFPTSTGTLIHIVIGYDEVGRYTLAKDVKDIYFKDWKNKTLPVDDTANVFHIEYRGRELDFRVSPILKHLKYLNRYKGMSKPSKKSLEELKYINKSFISEEMDTLEACDDKLPNKEGLMNQKVYLHVRDTCTNSMLMSKDFDIQPQHLNVLINEVISMNPHLVKDLNVDYYEFESTVNNQYSGVLDIVAGATMSKNKENIRQYFTIKEALYASIVNNMSKAKDIEVAYKRESIANQYIEAFINLKESLGNAGFSDEEIERLIKKREGGTQRIKLIMSKIFVNNPTRLHAYKAKLFNYINHKLEMHAIKKDKDNNRRIRDGVLQNNIAWLEQKVYEILNECKDINITSTLTIGVVARYLYDVDHTRRKASNAKTFLKELMKEDDIVNTLDALSETNPYKVKPIPKEKPTLVSDI